MFAITPIMITMEEMDDYIDNIEYKVIIGRLHPSEMKIVERYKEYRKKNRVFREVDFKKLMRHLMEEEDTVMKTNIVKYEIDKGDLRESVFKYQVLNKRDPYLFVNEETLGLLMGDDKKYSTYPTSGKMIVYEELYVFIHNDLAFGEVEIR